MTGPARATGLQLLGAPHRGPDRLGQHLALTAVALAVLAAIYLLMLRSWRRRRARAAGLRLPAPPARPGRELCGPVPGLLLGATRAGDWLDRVPLPGLGARSAGRLSVHAGGLLIAPRAGAPLWLPAPSLRAVRSDTAHAGRVLARGRIGVFTVHLDRQTLDLGFRPDDPARLADLLQAAGQLAEHRPPRPQAAVGETAGVPEQPSPQPARPAPALIGRAAAPALLVLEDGRAFRGEALGAAGETFGEAVFATGMTGYQETLTDPSYHRQVLIQTAPHIGNTGMNEQDPESDRIWVAGYVVRDLSPAPSSWRATRTLPEALAAGQVVGIAGVDTRALTRHLRERGAMRCGISTVETDPAALLERVRASPGMLGADLCGEVSTPQRYVVPAVGPRRFTVAALDLGIKRMTPVRMAERGVEVHVLPAGSSAADLLDAGPDGVFVSNGPGDPATADGPVAALRGVLDAGVPVFGICFGNQLLGRALGFGTYKLRFGHRGINQPVQDLATGKVEITAHNHGFAVDAPLGEPAATPYGRAAVSHVNLNDRVVEGLACLDVPAFSVQYHPEAAGGPHDAGYLFDRFTELMAAGGRPLAGTEVR